MESRRRSPSVIAKLMGLEPLPSQPPIHKEQRKFSENYYQKIKSIGVQEKYISHEDRSSRKSGKEQQEFKDVFEVKEPSVVEKAKCTTRTAEKGITSSTLSEVNMAFIRQKFMDAKRLSTNENLRKSKEFHDALEVLDSNKDLFLKFLREPDSLFAKHLHDLQAVPSSPHSNHMSPLMSSTSTKYKKNEIGWLPDRKMEKQMQWKDTTKHSQKHERGHVSHDADNLDVSQFSSRFEGRGDTYLLPTRIVVLKPSLGRAQTASTSVSSPGSSMSSVSNYRKHREFRRSGNRELFPDLRDRPKSVNSVDLLRHRTRSSREIAREITQQMRQRVNSSSANVSSSGKGYVGDESSYCPSSKDSTDDDEAVAEASRHFYDRSSRHLSFSSYHTESSVSREARKRLSERWKMTNRLRGPVNRSSSTLGEMLAMSDRETEPATSTSRINRGGSHNNSSGVELERWGCPSGISSRDGWKDAFPRSLPRSRSVPASSTVYGSQKTRSRHGTSDENHFKLKDVTDLDTSYAFKEYTDREGDFFPGNLEGAKRKFPYHFHEDGEESPTIREIHVDPDETKNIFELRDVQQVPAVEPSDNSTIDMPPAQIDISECKEVQMVCDTPEEPPSPEPLGSTTLEKVGESADWDQKDLIVEVCFFLLILLDTTLYGELLLIRQITVNSLEMVVKQHQEESHSHTTEPESPESPKEAEQPSPVSVLEPAFEVETSSSECFERVSADLHGLRMQLQLLRLETAEVSTEGSDFNVSSDEEPGESCSSGFMEDKGELSVLFRDAESRDFSFLLDVLSDSGFHDANHEILLAPWYSLELPISPGTFDVLEKKYGGQEIWPKSERRLLFDLINSALAEVLGQHKGRRPWMKQRGRRARVAVGHNAGFADAVWELVVQLGKERSSDSDTAEKALGRADRWLELGDDIEGIGKEIEELMMGELLQEVFCGLSS
ncbi:hypothetical protein ACLOJK_001670 [Asimina triloba]